MVYKHLSLIIILIILVNKVVHGQNFIPGPRLGQAAVLIGDRVYYIGGIEFTPLSNFFYLEFDKTWVDLASQGVNLPLKARHTADIGGPNQDLIFITGGVLEEQAENEVYQFDTTTNKLTTPIIQGKTPPPRGFINSVSYKGKIYILGGKSDTIYNGLDILDTINLIWGAGSLINAPLPRFAYTATLVGDIIYYIGGLQQDGVNQVYDPLSNIYQYNIGTDTWATKVAAGTTPGVRSDHTAVLVGAKICIFGGRYMTTDMVYAIPPTNPIAMLDTTTLVWSIPQLDNPKVPNVAYHSAILWSKLMLVAFGNLTDVPGGAPNNNFYIFNFSEDVVTWVSATAEELIASNPTPSSTNPPNPPSTPNSSPNPSPNTSTSTTNSPSTTAISSNELFTNKKIIVGLSVGFGTLGIASIVAFILIYKRMKKNKNTANTNAFGTGVLQIPSAGAKYYPTMNQVNQQYPVTQQFTQPTLQYHSTPTSQSQGYSPGQGYSNLQALPERNSTHPSNFP